MYKYTSLVSVAFLNQSHKSTVVTHAVANHKWLIMLIQGHCNHEHLECRKIADFSGSVETLLNIQIA